MHPLFVSIANIPGHIRMAASSYAWRCVAFMPIPKFDVPAANQSILQARIVHKCIDIVTEGLKRVAETGSSMVDPHGHIRYCFTPLAAWTADLPEQLMLSCLSKSASPVTEATQKQFGDAQPYPPRTGELTLKRIDEVNKKTGPWDLSRYQKLAKALQLNGVDLPFFRNWRFANPSTFLLPEVLHTCHKFFFDHVLPWCKKLLGAELDARFKCHHKRTGVRHFAGGVSHVKQMTGRDHRDIQRTIVAMIAGRVPGRFLCAIRALIDFIYQAQSPVYTDSSIEEMEASLREFHAHKDVIIEVGARKKKANGKADFCIPKLELFQSFGRAVRNSGALIFHTADVSERLLKTHCKETFERTSKNKDFGEQIARILNRGEAVRQFDLYTLLLSSDVPLINAICAEEERERATDPAFAWVGRVLPNEQWQIQGPRPVRNYFPNGILTTNAEAALHVTLRPDETNLSLDAIAMQYHLPDFKARYMDFLRSHCHDIQFPLIFECTALWYKFRVQLRSTFDPSRILPSQAVQAKPPSQDFPYGCCDAVLITPSSNGMQFLAYALVTY